MFKSVITFIFVTAALTLFATSTLSAQSFFDFNSSKNSNDQSAQTTAPKPVLSPSEFKNKVNKMGQQTKSNLMKPFGKTPVTPPPAVPDESETVTTTAATPPPTPVPPPAQPQQPPAATNSSPVPPLPTTTRSAPPTAPLPAQNDTYTGFGGGNAGSSTTTTNPSGSGWNIKY